MSWPPRKFTRKAAPKGRTVPEPAHRPATPARERRNGPSDTSWEKSADWYDRILGERGSELYRRIVIPKALALLAAARGASALDLGCGQGVFSRALAASGCMVTGVDLSPALVKKAGQYPGRAVARYLHRDAADIRDLGPVDAISAILCLQNMPHLAEVCASCASILRSGGRMVWVLNHPCFRIPRQTHWGYDEGRKLQYRRLDAYGSPLSIPIIMHPGQKESEQTVSFHHSLADLMQPAFSAGFRMARLEEWYSDKQSEPGPRSRAENRARREFPLFLALCWEK